MGRHLGRPFTGLMQSGDRQSAWRCVFLASRCYVGGRRHNLGKIEQSAPQSAENHRKQVLAKYQDKTGSGERAVFSRLVGAFVRAVLVW
jgi:hypothetical protein